MLDKFKFLKNNQIIMIVIALMLIFVGYLNFSSVNNEKEEKDGVEYAGIGDAKLVSSSNIEETAIVENDEQNTLENNIGEAVSTNAESTVNEITNVVTTSSAKEEDEFFSSSKLNRQTMYSQMLETYQKILENDQISQDQKSIAQTEIKNINDTKNKIMICENLIKLKDIDDVVIFVNDPSISVIVKEDKLKQDQIAQIQNIITREMNAEVDNIHISNR